MAGTKAYVDASAGAFPTAIGTLDVVLFTHDRQLVTAARASGLDVKTFPR